FSSDTADSVEIIRRRGGKPSLNGVDAKTCKLACHFQLLGRSQSEARRLLAISKCGVKDLYVVSHLYCASPPIRAVALSLGLLRPGTRDLNSVISPWWWSAPVCSSRRASPGQLSPSARQLIAIGSG